MEKYDRIIFVCTGNTCRSPMAEVLLKNIWQNDEVEITSRGLVVLFPEPVNPKSEAVCRNHGMNLEGFMARQLTRQDITDRTLLLCMTARHEKHIMREYTNAKHVYIMKEFAGEAGDVTDPYGGSLLVYEECFVELSRLIKKIIFRLAEDK